VLEPERLASLDGAPMHGGLGLVVPTRRGDEQYVLKVEWVDELIWSTK
jgi:hypothetical protein